MTLFETIFVRRSVRKYDAAPLDEGFLGGLRKFLEETEQLSGQKTSLEIVPGGTAVDGKAPHYILAYCANSAAEFINAGYVLQKADLYLQSAGLGSLWLGTAKPKEKAERDNFCIMLAFGKTGVPLRNSAEDFDRLPLRQISAEDNLVARAARLAPSAVNSQPWELVFEEGKVIIKYRGRGLLKGFLKPKLSKIDLGIVTRHAELALLNEGKNIIDILPKGGGDDFFVEINYTDTKPL